MRQRTSPINRNTTRQQQTRSRLASSSQMWRGLTEPQRQAYEGYAATHPYTNRVGEAGKILSGAAIFNRLTCRVMDFGGTVLTDPPITPYPAGLLTFSVARTSATTATLTHTITPLPAGYRLQVWMSVPANGNVSPTLRQCVLVGYTAAAAATGEVMSLPRPWAIGQTCTFFAAVVDQAGQRSDTWLRSKVTA